MSLLKCRHKRYCGSLYYKNREERTMVDPEEPQNIVIGYDDKDEPLYRKKTTDSKIKKFYDL
jgi:hypothetical protein